MGRRATFAPIKDQKKSLWYVSIPGRLSPTGKRAREYFKAKKDAEKRSSSLVKMEKHFADVAKHVSPDLIRDAVELNDLSQLYGFSGLREAFSTLTKDFERRNMAVSLGELFEGHENDSKKNWSSEYLKSRWKPFCKKFAEISDQSIAVLDSDFWRKWFDGWHKKVSPAPATYNQILSLMRTVFGHEKAREVHKKNPLEHLSNFKDVRSEICISPTEEVKGLLEWCHENDSELIPYFAIGFFAGMRPQAELQPMQFEQINFEEGILDCVTTKTHRKPRRQIPMEPNLKRWLKPFQGSRGSILPKNFTKRHNKAKKESGIIWGHDIMRHSYGSYFEAFHRSESGCRERIVYNMGHTSFKTYEQKYRNGKVTPKQAKDFWSIKPPA